MFGQAASAATATIMVLAGSAPSLNTAVTALSPEVGQCYNMPKSQLEANWWRGGSPTSCRDRHLIEVIRTGWIPDRFSNSSEGTRIRYAAWQCRKAQMAHGPLTRLNGLTTSWFLTEPLTSDPQSAAGYACAVAMGGTNPIKSIKSAIPYSQSDGATPICASWNGQTSKWTSCRKGRHQLTRFKLLDPTFQANFPGIKASERLAWRACRASAIVGYPSTRREWLAYPVADCYTKM